MVELAHAYVQIVPSMSGVGRAIQDAFGSAGDKGGAQAGKNFTSGFSAKIGAVAGVTASVFNKVAGVVASSLNSAIGRADQMNNFPKVMKNLGYSSEDAAGEHQEDQRSARRPAHHQLGHDRHGAAARPIDLEPRRGHRHRARVQQRHARRRREPRSSRKTR